MLKDLFSSRIIRVKISVRVLSKSHLVELSIVILWASTVITYEMEQLDNFHK